MVFDQREHKTLYVVAQPPRLREAGPLVVATAIVVVALDLDGHLSQTFFREFRQPSV